MRYHYLRSPWKGNNGWKEEGISGGEQCWFWTHLSACSFIVSEQHQSEDIFFWFGPHLLRVCFADEGATYAQQPMTICYILGRYCMGSASLFGRNHSQLVLPPPVLEGGEVGLICWVL